MPGRYREHLVQIGTFDDVEPADKCLRLRVRAVGDDGLAVTYADGGPVSEIPQAVADEAYAAFVQLRRPGANVPTGSVGSSSSQTIIKYFMGATCLPVSPSEELTGSPFNIMSHPPT